MSTLLQIIVMTWAMDFAKNFGIKELLQKQAGRLLDNTARDLEWNGQTLPAGFVNHVYMASLNGKFAAVMPSTDYLL